MTKMSKQIVWNLEIYLTRQLENCDERNHGQKNTQKNEKKNKKKEKNPKKPKKHWNEIQKPSAWYALGLKIALILLI